MLYYIIVMCDVYGRLMEARCDGDFECLKCISIVDRNGAMMDDLKPTAPPGRGIEATRVDMLIDTAA